MKQTTPHSDGNFETLTLTSQQRPHQNLSKQRLAISGVTEAIHLEQNAVPIGNLVSCPCSLNDRFCSARTRKLCPFSNLSFSKDTHTSHRLAAQPSHRLAQNPRTAPATPVSNSSTKNVASTPSASLTPRWPKCHARSNSHQDHASTACASRSSSAWIQETLRLALSDAAALAPHRILAPLRRTRSASRVSTPVFRISQATVLGTPSQRMGRLRRIVHSIIRARTRRLLTRSCSGGEQQYPFVRWTRDAILPATYHVGTLSIAFWIVSSLSFAYGLSLMHS